MESNDQLEETIEVYTPAISVIIPVYGKKHLKNFRIVMKHLEQQEFDDFETIAVEDKGRIYSNIDCTKYISVKGPIDKPINKNWLLNIGANISTGGILVFLDADIVVEKDYLEIISNTENDWMIGWGQLKYLNEDGSSAGIIGSGPCGAAGGIQVFKRDFFFEKFFGHNENYFGWGGEDNDSTLRASILAGKFNIAVDVLVKHLYHDHYRNHSKETSDQWWISQHHAPEITRLIGENRTLGRVGCFSFPNHVDIENLW